jgi:hypothetical protein
LEVLWKETDAREEITEGYDVVVLQEDVPETDVDSTMQWYRAMREA